MSNERVIYTRQDGGVSVIVPSPNYKGTMAELIATQQARGDLVATDTPEVVDVADVPSDRTLRDAWKRGEQGKKVGVDMIKGKAISHEKRRAKRAIELAPLDIEATIPAKASQAEAARQVIRDKYATIQTNIDAATTPEQLKAIIDSEGL